MTMILRVAKSKTSEDDDDKPMSKDEKKGEWNLYLRKHLGTKWGWTLVNPKGGSSGSSEGSKSRAMGAAIGRGVQDLMGKERVWVVEQAYDSDTKDYVTKKTYWEDLKEGKPSGGASRDHDR